MIARLTELMVRSGAEWVLWWLLATSVVSFAIAIERWLAYRRVDHASAERVPRMESALRAADLERAKSAAGLAGSVAGSILSLGIEASPRGSHAVEQALAAGVSAARKRLEARLIVLGTVGNNAPFVGLLGTVIGVVGAFDALGQTSGDASALAPERVMGTIAEALVATAVGLLVAIPAVAAFNYFQKRVTDMLADAEALGHLLLSALAKPESTQWTDVHDEPLVPSSRRTVSALRSAQGQAE